MPRYIVLSKLSCTGHLKAKQTGKLHPALAGALEEQGGKVLEQYQLFGEYDVCSLIEVRDNDTAQLVELACSESTDRHAMIPAIDLALFARLLGRSTATTGPYRWQISWPARIVRRVYGRSVYTNIARQYFKPLTVIGREHIEDLKGPAIFIANHSSFMDGPAMYAALPSRYKSKTAWPSAADRFFIKGRKELRKQGWWHSLMFNSFPLKRGGGRAALAHADWLLDKGWSIGIFPEGARTSSKKLARFRHGPAILAVDHQVPVVPIYLDGLAAIRPKGSSQMQPGPVTVRIGPLVRFPPGADVGEATKALQRAVTELADQAAQVRRAQRAASSADGSGKGSGNGRQAVASGDRPSIPA